MTRNLGARAFRSRAVCAALIASTGLLAACGSGKPPIAPTGGMTEATFSAAQPAERCVNVAAEGTATLGPVLLPNGAAGFGATASVTLGDVSGVLSSVLLSQDVSGSKEQGASHLTLQHAFQVSGTGDYFVTEDRAVCAPADANPLTCRVNDVLTIVAGTGIFTNATGSLRNLATADFAQGTMEFSTRGRVCGDGL